MTPLIFNTDKAQLLSLPKLNVRKVRAIKAVIFAYFAFFWIFPCAAVVAQPHRDDLPVPVVVETALLINQATRHTFVGSLTPVRSSTVGSAIEGRIIKLSVELGDLLSCDSANSEVSDKGDDSGQADIIAIIDSEALDLQINSAKVDLQSRKQLLTELQLSLPEDIALAKANVAQARVESEYSKESYERQVALSKRGGGLSAREIALARSTYLSQQQAWTAANVTLRKLEATREIKLQIAKTAIEVQLKALEQLSEQLKRHTVRAPFNGAVVQKMADVGDWVSRGTPIIQIVQLNPIELTVQVPQEHLIKLQVSFDRAKSNDERPRATVTLDGFSEAFTGTVWAIVPQANLRTRSFPVVIRLDNPAIGFGYKLKPGMLAKATFEVGVNRKAVLIKKDALVLGTDETSVVLAVPSKGNSNERVAKIVLVTTGQAFGESIEVLSGISAGDQVIVRGNERVRPGQKLKILK